MSASLLIRTLIAGTMLAPSVAVGPGSDDALPRNAAASTASTLGVPAGEPPAPGQIAEWVAATRDNGGLPFFVVDRTYAQLYVFDAAGSLQAVAPVTTDADRGDRSAGFGGARPAGDTGRFHENEKSAPAARFIAAGDGDLREEGVAPAAAYENVINKILAGSRVVVYVVPETPAPGVAASDYVSYTARQPDR
jgi:hypothetical protein